MEFEPSYTQENFTRRSQEILSNCPSTNKIDHILQSWSDGLSLGLEDLICLLSPQADKYLDEMISCARLATRQRFGQVIQFYAPLYLSNHCHSTCTYCGFSRSNSSVQRLTLSIKEAIAEAQLVHKSGIRHILLLTGEDYKQTPISYIEEIIKELSNDFASISIEIYPLDTTDYICLRQAGLDGVAVYQETYDPQRYQQVHLGGMKKQMLYRLNCPDRVGSASIRRIAIGALLGLSEPATEVFFIGLHARHLLKYHWQSELSISLPRLRPAAGITLETSSSISDRNYLRYLCALRLFLPEVGLNLSTREAPAMRNQLAEICISHMSAGSKTEPGGYSGKQSSEQFEISDKRSIHEVSQSLVKRGLEPLLVDWSPVLK